MKPFASGLVVGKFAPLHRGHELVIRTALEQCERVAVMVWANPDYPAMPTPLRAGWVETLFPDVTVRAFAPEEAPPDDAPDAAQRAFTRDHLPFPVEAVFTSEAYGPGLAAVLEAVHVPVDPGRRAVPTSGTALRADVHGHRRFLDPRVYAHFVERVVLMGAESSGKSTLAQALAEHLKTVYVEEVGRTLWVEAGGDLPLGDYVRICEEHRALEDRLILHADRYLVVDTNAITTQQYAFFFFGRCPPEVQRYADLCKARYAHTVLCRPDFGLVQDGTRVHPQVQAYMDGAIRNDLTIRGIPYHVVGGTVSERVEAVARYLKSRPVQSLEAR